MSDELALISREKLPDALRVLLADYPRDAWQNDPGFDGLIRFWLDRHLMFRRLMAEMGSVTDKLLDRKLTPHQFAANLSRYGGMFVNGLHEHHTIEDSVYFPKLMQKDKRISRGSTSLTPTIMRWMNFWPLLSPAPIPCCRRLARAMPCRTMQGRSNQNSPGWKSC